MLRRSAFLGCLAVATSLSLGQAELSAPGSIGLIATAAAQQVTLPPGASLVTPPMPGGAAQEPNAAPMAGTLTPIASLTTTTPVVLELFTAEGCASCLPADANVGQWAGRRAVLVLTYHVDYWDYIGWRDSKAEPAFAQRQLGYVTAFGRNMVYTPQLIIAGKDESLGTDHDRLAVTLTNSAPVARMTPLRLLRDQDGRILADLPAASLEKPATLWLMTYRRQIETDILAGENAGKHVAAINVVRTIQRLGQWSGLAEQVLVPIDLQAGGAVPADAAAIIANQGEFGPIIAATAVSFDSLR